VVRPAAHPAALLVEEDIIDAPGIDADAVQLRLDGERLGQSGFQLQAELRIIPVKRAAFLGRPVGEAVDFGQRQLPVLQFADNRPAARSAQVKREKAAHG